MFVRSGTKQNECVCYFARAVCKFRTTTKWNFSRLNPMPARKISLSISQIALQFEKRKPVLTVGKLQLSKRELNSFYLSVDCKEPRHGRNRTTAR